MAPAWHVVVDAVLGLVKFKGDCISPSGAKDGVVTIRVGEMTIWMLVGLKSSVKVKTGSKFEAEPKIVVGSKRMVDGEADSVFTGVLAVCAIL